MLLSQSAPSLHTQVLQRLQVGFCVTEQAQQGTHLLLLWLVQLRQTFVVVFLLILEVSEGETLETFLN